MDTNYSMRRLGGADRMHGGRSRLRDETLHRSLVFRGKQSRERILAGFKEFATDYYHHLAGLSTFFKNAGFDDESLQATNESHTLENLLMDFCPAFRKWVHQFAGEKAMELVIEYYGLFGDDRLPLETLEYNLALDNAVGYKVWALDKLRAPDAMTALQKIARDVGNDVL